MFLTFTLNLAVGALHCSVIGNLWDGLRGSLVDVSFGPSSLGHTSLTLSVSRCMINSSDVCDKLFSTIRYVRKTCVCSECFCLRYRNVSLNSVANNTTESRYFHILYVNKVLE